MAHFYPEISDDFHNSLGEYKIFQALKSLSNAWNIYYSLTWQKRSNNGRITWGEADFAIFNPTYGILVIEVKSGGIRCENGEWYQKRLDTDEEFKMKDPFKQADRSKYKIIEEIDGELLNGDRCFVDKAVWFPSISKSDINSFTLPLSYNISQILSEDDLNNPEQSLIKVFNYYNSLHFTRLQKEGVKVIENILMPNFDLIPSSSNIKNETDYVFLQLTNEQKKVLDFIGDQSSVAIEGGAGTGKTFVAVEQAKRFSKNGKVLFLCFNRFLNKHLVNKCYCENVDYYNIHSFVGQHSTGNLLTDQQLLTAIKDIDFKTLGYSYIIIDEAQDIYDKILEYLTKYCITNDIRLFIFYDKNQLLYYKNMPNILKLFDCKLKLTKNCRNTQKILNTMNSIIESQSLSNELCISGVMPILNYSDNSDELSNSIIKNIKSYLDSGYSYEDITILTMNTEDDSIINNKRISENLPLSNEIEKDKILFTTSKKFKGLESNVIILVDFNPLEIENEEYLNNFYVATSRARQRLEIYSHASLEEISHLVEKIEENINTSAKVAKKYKIMLNKI